MQDLEACEHTAQVPYEVREDREESFRAGRLPILYCSPTMELGVDISELNAVNLRNIPLLPRPTTLNAAAGAGAGGWTTTANGGRSYRFPGAANLTREVDGIEFIGKWRISGSY